MGVSRLYTILVTENRCGNGSRIIHGQFLPGTVLKIDQIAVKEDPRIISPGIGVWRGKIKDLTHCVSLQFLSHPIYVFFSWVEFHTKLGGKARRTGRWQLSTI